MILWPVTTSDKIRSNDSGVLDKMAAGQCMLLSRRYNTSMQIYWKVSTNAINESTGESVKIIPKSPLKKIQGQNFSYSFREKIQELESQDVQN